VRVKLGSNERAQRDTGMALSLLLILIGLYSKQNLFFAVAALLLLITMTIPKLLKYPSLFWFGLSEVMGKVVSKLLLTAVFFLVISPIAIVMRVLGKDQLNLRNHNRSSAFSERAHEFEANDLKNPF
jgi:hypothetical protein